MNSLTAILVAFTTLVCVNCLTQNEVIELNLIKYLPLPFGITCDLIWKNTREIEAMMEDAAAKYDEECINVTAKYYRELIYYVNQSLPTIIAEIGNQSNSILETPCLQSKLNILKLGVIAATIRWKGGEEEKNRAATGLIVTDTSPNLEKQLQDLFNFTINNCTLANVKLNNEDMPYYATLHTTMGNFVQEGSKRIFDDIRALNDENCKAKNLQVFINDIKVLLSIAAVPLPEVVTLSDQAGVILNSIIGSLNSLPAQVTNTITSLF